MACGPALPYSRVDTVQHIFTLGFALDQMRLNFRDLERAVRENARGGSSPR
jgi:hypothetical protein